MYLIILVIPLTQAQAPSYSPCSFCSSSSYFSCLGPSLLPRSVQRWGGLWKEACRMVTLYFSLFLSSVQPWTSVFPFFKHVIKVCVFGPRVPFGFGDLWQARTELSTKSYFQLRVTAAQGCSISRGKRMCSAAQTEDKAQASTRPPWACSVPAACTATARAGCSLPGAHRPSGRDGSRSHPSPACDHRSGLPDRKQVLGINLTARRFKPQRTAFIF